MKCQEALQALKRFKRPWPENWDLERAYERRAEMMRRAKMLGVTYIAMAEVLGMTAPRARQIVMKAQRRLPPNDWIMTGKASVFMRANVSTTDAPRSESAP